MDIENANVNGFTFDKLKSLFDVGPQLIEDMSTMFDTFPHDNVVTQFLYSFVSELIFVLLFR